MIDAIRARIAYISYTKMLTIFNILNFFCVVYLLTCDALHIPHHPWHEHWRLSGLAPVSHPGSRSLLHREEVLRPHTGPRRDHQSMLHCPPDSPQCR